MNHSCRPNVRVDVELRLVVALRDIAAEESITYFYPSTEWEMAEPFGCGCGEPGCLGLIRGARDLPVEEVLARHPAAHIRALLELSPGAATPRR